MRDRSSRCRADRVARWPRRPAAAQERPALMLTLDEAQARALQASHRLPEVQAREAAALARRRRALAPRSGRSLSAQAGYTRTNHVLEFAVPTADRPAARALSRRAQQLPHAPRPAVADLHRRPHRRARARGPGGSRGGGGRSGRWRAPICGSKWRAAFWAVVTARSSGVRARAGPWRARRRISRDVRAAARTPASCRRTRWRPRRRRSRAPRMLLIEARNQRDVASADLARLTGVDLDAADRAGRHAGGDAGTGRRSQRRSWMARERRAASACVSPGASRPRTSSVRRPLAGRLPIGGGRPAVSTTRGRTRASSRAPIAGTTRGTWACSVNWSFWDGGRAAADAAQAARPGRLPRGSGSPSSMPCSPSRCGSGRSRSSRDGRRSPPADDAVARRRPRRAASSTERYRAGVVDADRGARRRSRAAAGRARSHARAGQRPPGRSAPGSCGGPVTTLPPRRRRLSPSTCSA